MAAVNLSITGGDKIAAKLSQMAGRLGRGGEVAVGFLEGATYPAVAKKALADTTARISKRDRAGLTKAAASTDSPTVPTVAFWNEFGTSRAPPRPFFRQMIAAKSPNWGNALGAAAKKTNYDTPQTLGIVGEVIQGQLVRSINDFTSPPLAASTIARKGFSKPLIDTSVMIRAVDYEVKT